MTDHDPSTSTFEWTPPTSGIPRPSLTIDGLAGRLSSLAEDRGSTADDVVRRTAAAAEEWLSGSESPNDRIQERLQSELRDIYEAHGWRGPVARFERALGGVPGALASQEGGSDPAPQALREALALECAHWAGTADGATTGARWNGEPLTPGVRLGDKSRCAAPLLDGLRGLGPGETILVHGWSETVARGIELAQARGLAPEIIVSEGGPDLGGRRLARRLVASGMTVRFIYDAALVHAAGRVDRIWLGTEALSERTFLGRVGTHSLLNRAADLDVPVAILATTDKRVPRGASLSFPRWSAEEPWHLWEGAPRDVMVESQSFEEISLDLVGTVATEHGAVGAKNALHGA